MSTFQQYPFIRFSLFFALGIVSRHYLGDAIMLPIYLLIGFLAIYLFLLFLNSFRFQAVLSILTFALIFNLGAYRLDLFKIDEGQIIKADAYQAIVLEVPQEKANSYRTVLETQAIHEGDQWIEWDARVNAYLSKDSSSSQINYGDVLIVRGAPELTTPPSNPGEFNYKNYLSYQNIHYQQFIGDDFIEVGAQPPNWVVQKAIEIRGSLRSLLLEYIPDAKSNSIVQALVLGIKDDLDNEVIRSFSATGAMHILAVSGLHVGIIYGIIFFLFKFIKLHKRKYRWYVAFFSIAIFWSYALITGLSPSVLRAVTMFSFVALGQALFRKGNIYNTLALSALVLLLFSPYLIMSVGFQLSFLAVFGIVYLHPKLYALLTIDQWFLDKLWSLTCVSIAAQLATGPLSLLYFHQFPTYFLISNLFIIPAAFIILIGGLLLLLFSLLPALASIWGKILSGFVWGINFAVEQLSKLPKSTIDGVYLSILDTWLLYTVLILVVIYFKLHKKAYLKLAFVASLAFSFSQYQHFAPYSNTSEFSVLGVNNSSVLDFRKGFDSKLIADSLFLSDQEAQQFNLHGKRMFTGSNHKIEEDRLEVHFEILPFGQLILFERKTILWVNSSVKDYNSNSEVINVDFLIFSNNSVTHWEEISGFVCPDQVIVDDSYSYYKRSELMESLKSADVNVYQISTNGYFSSLWKN